MRIFPWLVLVALSGCTTTKKAEPPKIETLATDELMKDCDWEAGDPEVVCHPPTFLRGVLGCSQTERGLAKCKRRLESVEKIQDIDRAECEGHLTECRRKLDSPWRSWWVWGLIGAAVGVAVGVGVSYGAAGVQKKATQEILPLPGLTLSGVMGAG